MKKYEFRNELSEAAEKVYANSSFVFFIDDNGTFYVVDSPRAPKEEIGTLADVEEYLMMFAEEEE